MQHDRLGGRDRARDPCAARDQVEDLLGCGDRLRRGPEHPGLPRRSRLPRGVAGTQCGSGAHGGQIRPEHRRQNRSALDFRPQELFLPRFAEGLPDKPIRGTRRAKGLARDRARRRLGQDRRRDARALGGGRRQVAPRGARQRERHRFEPRGHAAARNRLRARHALGEGSRRLHEEGAHAGALPRDLRRQHAGGIRSAAMPMYRCGRAAARSSARAPRSRT